VTGREYVPASYGVVMSTGHINPRYGNASATAPTWDEIESRLSSAQLYWIVTVRTDRRPHAVPLVGVWHDDAFHFCTGHDEQKHRNLESNAQVAVLTGTMGVNGWDSGKDIVVEGRALRVTDPDALEVLAQAWFDKYGDDWRYDVRGDEFYELSNSGDGAAGGARVYRVAPAKVIVFGDEHGQTTYRS
jgi:general stress protein 26